MAKEENRGWDWPGKDGSPVPRTNHLLVIGIDAYKHHRKLNNARRDAEAFRDLMLSRYQFDPEHVYGLFDQDATRRNIIAALEALEQRLTEQDNLLIYFSGHGTMNRRKSQGFWVPVDAKRDGTADYLANTRVRDILADMQVHHLYLIVDACFAGSMIVRKSETAHLDLSEASPSRRVLSSGRQEVVSDGRPGEHSPFFNCLQHQLSQPLPAPLTAKSLELYVSQNTPRTAEQQPVAEFIYGIGDQSGQFVFHPKRDVKAEFTAAKAANTAAALEIFLQAHPDSPYQAEAQVLLAERKDEEAWQAAQQANTIAAYRRYRRDYNQGKYREQALAQIKSLEIERAWREAQRLDTIFAYEEFLDTLNKYRSSEHAADANAAIERLLNADRDPKAWQKAQAAGTLESYQQYLQNFPQGQFTAQARQAIERLKQAQAERERLAREEAERKQAEEAQRKAQQEQAERERKAREEADRKRRVEEKRKAEQQQAEQERLAREAAERKRQEEEPRRESTPWYTQPVARWSGGLILALFLVWGGFRFWPDSSAEPAQFEETAEAAPITHESASQSPSDQPLNLADYGLPDYELITIEGGTFQMGSNDGGSDEKPIHRVTVSTFQMGKTEVTQELWEAVMGSNPSGFRGVRLPVESVSWNDCQEFIQKLNQRTGLTFRLPTEAEWEYAAGGGEADRTTYAGTSNSSQIGGYAWYTETTNDPGTRTVATKQPNPLGLYDMSGNVWEWCQDWYSDYPSEPQTNPTGPATGKYRVLRGGSWYDRARHCRVDYRLYQPGFRIFGHGLRLARTL